MHSRIFEISKTKFTNKDNWLSEDHYDLTYEYVDPIYSVADYVVPENDEDRLNSIKWLDEELKEESKGYYELNLEEGTIKFKEGFKEMYFNEAAKSIYSKLKEALKEKELFMKKYREEELFSYQLANLLTNTHSFYVVSTDFDTKNLDSFVRELEYNKTYYIGRTYDYHF